MLALGVLEYWCRLLVMLIYIPVWLAWNSLEIYYSPKREVDGHPVYTKPSILYLYTII